MKKIIQKFRIDTRIRLGYGSAFFLLLISYLFTVYANYQLQEQAKRVDQTNQLITKLEKLSSEVTDAVAGFRGFVLMKDNSFLEPFYEAAKQVPVTLEELRERTRDNKSQQTTLLHARNLVEGKFKQMSTWIQYYPQTGYTMTDSLNREIQSGKIVMERLRTLIRGMQIQEHYLLSKRTEELTARYNSLNSIKTISLILAFLLLLFGFITYIVENKARRKADRQVAAYQEELEQRILELDKANKELIQMRSQEKFASTGRIARTIAHEVRNPLTNIDLAVDQLRSELDGKDKHNNLIFDLITRNSHRINQLITGLLDSTKFVELNYEKASLNSLLDEALELAKDRLSLKRIRVIKSYSPDICDINVDKEKFKIAVLNLIVNAIEAVEPGKGVLKLHSRLENGKCVIEVSDNGHGMDKESMSKVFEPYFTSKTNGTGLGLTNTQNIILNHKGDISVESELGKGTTFTISLDISG
jgi:signal transduction histidine kinase